MWERSAVRLPPWVLFSALCADTTRKTRRRAPSPLERHRAGPSSADRRQFESSHLTHGPFKIQSAQHALRGKRHPAQARAGCIENSVGDRGRDWHDRGFASAEGLHFRPIDKYDFDVRDLIESDDGVAVPVEIFLSGGVELNLFQQCPAHCLDDLPLSL